VFVLILAACLLVTGCSTTKGFEKKGFAYGA
jgi:predicted small secreted protein